MWRGEERLRGVVNLCGKVACPLYHTVISPRLRTVSSAPQPDLAAPFFSPSALLVIKLITGFLFTFTRWDVRCTVQYHDDAVQPPWSVEVPQWLCLTASLQPLSNPLRGLRLCKLATSQRPILCADKDQTTGFTAATPFTPKVVCRNSSSLLLGSCCGLQ